MRFLQFLKNNQQYVGLELGVGGDILDLNSADIDLPRDLRSFIEGGESMMKTATRLAQRSNCLMKRDSVKIIAPIISRDKVLCVGMNYKDHCEEQNAPVPVEPVLFNKFPSCIIGPYDSLTHPKETEYLDCEAELAIVIGKTAECQANDVSARDWLRRNGGQVLLGKSRDQFCPVGPVVVTTDEMTDPHNLRLSCRVNGVTKQNGNTNNLIHKTEQIIAFISRFITLRPGDLILTGTPPGSGWSRKPPEYLKRGDIVEVDVERIGKLVTTIV